jgi:hypothetical protein
MAFFASTAVTVGFAAADPTNAIVPVPVAQVSSAPSAAPAAMPSGGNLYDGNWHVVAAPYAWLPSINGSLTYKLPRNPAGAQTLGVHVGASSYLSSVNSAFAGYVGVQKGEWTALADLIYANLSSSTGSVHNITGPKGRFVLPITTGLSTAMHETILEAFAGRTLAHGSAGVVNLVVGVRSISLTSSDSWNFSGPNNLISASGTVSATATLTDGVVAVQGNVNLGTPTWFVPYYADYGWGSGNSTAQQWLGIGMTAKQHGQRTVLVYRNLAYFTNGSQLLQVVRFGGPEVGYIFKI